MNETVFTVAEVARHIKTMLEENIPVLMVSGTVSDCHLHRSGHLYFTLNDVEASIKCVAFNVKRRGFVYIPDNGDRVAVQAKVAVYEKGGWYQLSVTALYPAGRGDKLLALEELKKKLAAEGLMAVERKRTVPAYATTVGVITSPQGAALADIRNIMARRWPVKLLLYPVAVQGSAAVPEILAALRYFAKNPPQVIIMARGGGSDEDLDVFNNEELARAVAASPVCIITAVGHEVDTTLVDLVADLRAPTPSAAAELAVPTREQVEELLLTRQKRLYLATRGWLSGWQYRVGEVHRRLLAREPRLRLQALQQRLDELDGGLQKAKTKLTEKSQRLEWLAALLEERSPARIMQRGYALVQRRNTPLSRVQEVCPGEEVRVIMADGSLDCLVKDVTRGDSL